VWDWTPAAKRDAVAHLRSAFDMSERRACTVIGCVRMTVRYHSHRPDDAGLRQRLRALAHERRRFGYRRLHILLRGEGFLVNHKRCSESIATSVSWSAVGADASGRWARGRRCPQWPNDRWSLDFVADQFIDGRRMRILGGRRLHPRVPDAGRRYLGLRVARTRSPPGRVAVSPEPSSATTAPN
jgi:putative transposase